MVTRISSALLESAFSRTRATVRQVLRSVVDGEKRRFEAAEVLTVFFVVMWLKFLPDYIAGENTWWVDDEGKFPTEGDVKATTALCDRTATSGAVLFDAALTSEREMETALLEYTKKIVARPEQYRILGWVSVAGALGFLKGHVAVYNIFWNPRVGRLGLCSLAMAPRQCPVARSIDDLGPDLRRPRKSRFSSCSSPRVIPTKIPTNLFFYSVAR